MREVINEHHCRQLKCLTGEGKLRAHLADDVALSASLFYLHESGVWSVRVRVFPDNHAAIELGSEPLEEFPSELMIAQAMLST